MNHVFIGLGGTGGRIIYAVRRAICQHYPGAGGEPRARRADGMLGEPDVRVGFLYLDSHAEELRMPHYCLGEPITLEPRWRLLIRDGRLADLIQNQAELRNITPWLGDRRRLQGVLGGGGNAPGAQQLRRIGRFLFANHVVSFRNRVKDLVNEVTGGVPNEAHFHLCGTLAGGTGGGAIVDAAVQLRRLYPNTDTFKIYVYALITADNAGQRDAGWFYPNQYAALKELNALASGLYRPHDLAGDGERIAADAPITACVLVSNVNQANIKSADVADQEQLTGDWLFQRAIGTQGNIPAGFDKAWTLEDQIENNPGEDRLPDEGGGNGGAIRPGQYSRTYRFSTIGIKRWAIPEQEIREKLVFTLAERAVLQILHANWVSQQGFADAPASRTAPTGWLPTGNNTAWELTDDQMCLNLQDGQKKFRENWQQFGEMTTTRLLNEEKNRRESWLSLAAAEFDKFWSAGFREMGTESFFTAWTRNIEQRTGALLNKIETDLLGHWRAGNCGLRDLERWLAQIDADLLARDQGLSVLAAKHQESLTTQEARLELIRQQWKKPRLITRLWKYNGLLRLGVDAMAKMHTERTWLLAREYQSELIAELRRKIGARRTALPSFTARLAELAENLGNAAKARCKDKEQDFVNDLVVREFSSDEVRAISDALVTSQDFQERLCGSVREALIEMAASRLNLGALSDLDIDALRSRLEKLANDATTVGHTDLTQDGGLKPVLGMSIVERLRVRFQGNRGALQLKIQDLLRGAVTAVKRTAANQAPAETRGNPEDPITMPLTQFAVFLPPPNGANDDFYEELERYFKDGIPGDAEAKVLLLKMGRRQEITMMAVDYWMAARFLDPIATLRKSYEATIERHGAEAVLRMHIEDAAADLPDLFKPPAVLKEARAWYFIGTKIGFVRLDAASGKIFAVFEDENGRPFQQPVELAVSSDGFYRGNIQERLGKLRDATRTILGRMSKDRRHVWDESLRAAAEAETERVHKETGGNTVAPAYRDWLAMKDEIERIWMEVTR